MYIGSLVMFRGDTAVCDFVLAKKTETALERSRGLIGHPPLTDDVCFWLNPCNSVHMFFMGQIIDIVYLDVHDCICKMVHDVKPWQISATLKAHSVLEIAAGGIKRHGLCLGDQVKWQS